MRAHVIKDGVVVNTIVVDSLDILPNLIDASLGGKIGDLWDGEAFTTPEIEIPILDQILILEKQVTQRRYREAILGTDNGWLSDVENQIAILRTQL